MVQFKHILVPTDFGESSQRALEVGIGLADRFHGSLTLLHTYEVPVYTYDAMTSSPVDLLTPIREAAEQQFKAALADIQKRMPSAKGILCYGVPWQEILRTIEDQGVDLVVMGTHGRRGITHALLGSVAEKIVRLSPVPVLTLRGPRS